LVQGRVALDVATVAILQRRRCRPGCPVERVRDPHPKAHAAWMRFSPERRRGPVELD
jgi:hypothetical protein